MGRFGLQVKQLLLQCNRHDLVGGPFSEPSQALSELTTPLTATSALRLMATSKKQPCAAVVAI
jgi:hypothetical protein